MFREYFAKTAINFTLYSFLQIRSAEWSKLAIASVSGPSIANLLPQTLINLLIVNQLFFIDKFLLISLNLNPRNDLWKLIKFSV